MAKVQSYLGGYQEHWMKNNKWIDDKGLIRWATTGIKNAASIEDILRRNPDCLGRVRCCVHVWRKFDHTVEELEFVKTTAEFDSWIRRWRALKEKLTEEKAEAYPAVDFGTENLRSPIVSKNNGLFCFKKKGRYLSELTDSNCRWTKDPSSAKFFSYEEATDWLHKGRILLAGASLIKAPKPE